MPRAGIGKSHSRGKVEWKLKSSSRFCALVLEEESTLIFSRKIIGDNKKISDSVNYQSSA